MNKKGVFLGVNVFYCVHWREQKDCFPIYQASFIKQEILWFRIERTWQHTIPFWNWFRSQLRSYSLTAYLTKQNVRATQWQTDKRKVYLNVWLKNWLTLKLNLISDWLTNVLMKLKISTESVSTRDGNYLLILWLQNGSCVNTCHKEIKFWILLTR